jgi:flavorubredoxin
MTSTRALSHTLDVIESLEVDRIAPQHGSIIASQTDAKRVIRYLRGLKDVGIDYLIAENRL